MLIRSFFVPTLFLLGVSSVEAGYSFTGTAVTENFNGINPAGTSTTGGYAVQFAIAGTGFDGAKLAPTSGASGATALPFLIDNGTTATNADGTSAQSSTGGLRSYGTTGAVDRALGTLASGTNTPGFGTVITNNSGSVLSSISLSFSTEEYRNSTSAQNFISFAYGLSGSSATTSNYLTSSSLTADARFDLVGDQPVTSNGGLATPIVTPVSGTINVTIGIGQSIFLRWQDFNDAGNDAGLAIDNFVFTGTPAGGTGPVAVPEPASCLMLGMGLVGGLIVARRRRSK